MSLYRVSKNEMAHLPEFADHEEVWRLCDDAVGLEGYIAFHTKRQGIPALGATRLWSYETSDDALRDALRLSRLMSYKSAMAHLPYTGAKAALVSTLKARENRHAFFSSYAAHVHELGGQFVTGTDVGVENEDIRVMKKYTPYVIGADVDSGFFTAQGILFGIEACVETLDHTSSLRGQRVAIQGLGKTGSHLLRLLVEQGAKVIASDIDPVRTSWAEKTFPQVEIVPSHVLLSTPVDIFTPCALGGVVNTETLPRFQCRMIAGSANNVLSHDVMAQKLHERDIVYAPDYVINAGGLISVVDEFIHGVHDESRILERLRTLKQTLRDIFHHSRLKGISTVSVAEALAEERLMVPHHTYVTSHQQSLS